MYHTSAAVSIRATGNGGLLPSTGEAACKRPQSVPITTTKEARSGIDPVAGSFPYELHRLKLLLMNSLCFRPTNSFFRGDDVNLMYLRSELIEAFPGKIHAESMHTLGNDWRGNFWNATPEQQDFVLEILFMCLFTRLMGRVTVLEDYKKNYTAQLGGCRQHGVPGRKQASYYCMYLAMNTLCNLSKAVNQQHPEQIPPKLKLLPRFRSFILHMANQGLEQFRLQVLTALRGYRAPAGPAPARPASPRADPGPSATRPAPVGNLPASTYVHLTEESAPRDTRCEVVDVFSRILLDAYDGSKTADDRLWDQVQFLSHQSIADLEEFVLFPFGLPTQASVHEGYGGVEGQALWKMLDTGGVLQQLQAPAARRPAAESGASSEAESEPSTTQVPSDAPRLPALDDAEEMDSFLILPAPDAPVPPVPSPGSAAVDPGHSATDPPERVPGCNIAPLFTTTDAANYRRLRAAPFEAAMPFPADPTPPPPAAPGAAPPRAMTPLEMFYDLAGQLSLASDEFRRSVSMKFHREVLAWRTGRPFTLTDLNNILCKILQDAGGAYASNTGAEHPVPFRTNCYPAPHGSTAFAALVDDHFSDALLALLHVLRNGMYPLPGGTPPATADFPAPPKNYLFTDEYTEFYANPDFWTFEFADARKLCCCCNQAVGTVALCCSNCGAYVHADCSTSGEDGTVECRHCVKVRTPVGVSELFPCCNGACPRRCNKATSRHCRRCGGYVHPPKCGNIDPDDCICFHCSDGCSHLPSEINHVPAASARRTPVRRAGPRRKVRRTRPPSSPDISDSSDDSTEVADSFSGDQTPSSEASSSVSSSAPASATSDAPSQSDDADPALGGDGLTDARSDEPDSVSDSDAVDPSHASYEEEASEGEPAGDALCI